MTAVEKLEISLLGIISFDSEELRAKYKERIAKANEMEKQQIVEAVDETNRKWKNKNAEVLLSGEQYYNETYNK
jgi:arginase family enzyme